MREFRKVPVGRVSFDACTYNEAVDAVVSLGAEPVASIAVRLANAWCVVVAEDNAEYADVLNGPGYTFPDGAPVAHAMSKIAPASERVRGPSLFVDVLDQGRATGLRHFFLGATETTLEMLMERVRGRLPGVAIVGHWAPPFGPIDEAFLAEARARIRDSGATFVWVGLGTPKQDFAAAALSRASGVPCAGVGAAFDFVAGTVREAPPWVQRQGFEWLYRLLCEPRRLWRRYLVGNFRFLKIVGRMR